MYEELDGRLTYIITCFINHSIVADTTSLVVNECPIVPRKAITS